MIKKAINYLGIFLFLLTANILPAQEAKPQNESALIDKVVAIVGRNIIRFSDIENAYVEQIRTRGLSESPFNSKCEILESFLISKILILQSEMDSVVIENEALDLEVDYYYKEFLKKAGSKEAVEREMNRTTDEIKNQLRESLRDQEMAKRTQQKITANVKVTPNDVAEFFKEFTKDSTETIPAEYEIMQIMKVPEINEDERTRVRDELNSLRERVLKGEKFSTLAALYSQDPGSAKKGGELGLFARGEMVSEFEATAFQLKPGEVSPVIETKFGFHILQLIERRGDLINARHILLIPKASLVDLQKAKFFLDSVSLLIQNKTYIFEEAAALFSDDPSKNNGGIVVNPMTNSSRFPERTANEYLGIKVANLEVGQITPPIAAKDEMNNDAFRILCLKTKIKEHKANLTDDYDKIYNAALGVARNEEMLKWCERRADKSFIKIYPPYDKCDFKIDWTKTNKATSKKK